MTRAHFWLAIWVGTFSVGAMGVGTPAAQAAEGWQAGAAKIVITPEQPMWMSGYGGRDKPAEGKLTELYAKALVLQDAAGTKACVVSLDLVGIDRGIMQRACEQLHQKYHLERKQIALCTSHTHCGPAVGRNLGPLHYYTVDDRQKKLIDDYTTILEQKIVTVVGQALANLAPSDLTWGSGRATYAVNRRNNSEGSVLDLRHAGKLVGPVDHDVPVLAVRKKSGELTAVLFGYACHATVLGFYQWCADHPGFAQAKLEQNHPGCVALFWAGCGADQNPLPRRTPELAQHYGERLAIAVDEVLLAHKPRPVEPQLALSYREIDLAFDQLPTREQIETEAKSSNKWVAARAKLFLEQLNAGKPLNQTYPYPIGVWRLGKDVQFVTLGGEVVVDFAVRLKSEMSGINTWVAGYSHDVMAYIPSLRVLREGGYEGEGAMVYYGQPTKWSPAVEDSIVREVHAQVASQPK